MKFEELYEKLKSSSDSEQIDTDKLPELQKWCTDNISTDIKFSGSNAAQLNSYLNLAKEYLDVFLQNPNINVAAAGGFDRYIATVNPDMINETDKYNMTPLHIAASKGHINTISALLSLGANTRKQNHHLQLPIHSVFFMPIRHANDLKSRKTAIFRKLKNKDSATLNIKDNSGDTVLHSMVSRGFAELIEETLKSTPELLSTSNCNQEYPIHTAILNGQIECVNILLKYKNVQSLVDARKRTPLHYAATNGNKTLVELCISATPDLNIKDANGRTPLLSAAVAGMKSSFDALVAKGANIHTNDNDGNSVLHCAVRSGNTDIVQWLLHNTDLDTNKPNINGETPISLCEVAIPKDEIKALIIEKNNSGITKP